MPQLSLLSGSLCIGEVARLLTLTKLGVSPSFVVASMHTVAICSIAILFSKMLDVATHPGSCRRWIVKDKPTKTDLHSPSFSSTRWCSEFKVIKQVQRSFGDVESSLPSENLPPATSGKMLKTLGLCRNFFYSLGNDAFCTSHIQFSGGWLARFDCVQEEKPSSAFR